MKHAEEGRHLEPRLHRGGELRQLLQILRGGGESPGRQDRGAPCQVSGRPQHRAWGQTKLISGEDER